MKPYTVEVTWRVPEYTHLTVQADSPGQAIQRALKKVADNPDAHERTLDYDSCGADVVTGLWEGNEAYPEPPGSTLPLPPTPNAISRPPSKRLSLTCAKDASRRSSCTIS